MCDDGDEIMNLAATMFLMSRNILVGTLGKTQAKIVITKIASDME